MKKILAFAAAFFVAATLGVWATSGTWNYPVPTLGGLVTGDVIYARSQHALGNLSPGTAGQALVSTGAGAAPGFGLTSLTAGITGTLPVANGGTGLTSAEKTDGTVFLPAVVYCRSDYANLLPVRVAAGNWGLRRTAAGAETYNVVCDLNSWLQRTTTSKGVKINSIGVHYGDTVANLTSNTFNGIYPVTYASGSAVSVGSVINTSATLQTASTANPYMTTVTVTTPTYLPTAANKALVVDFTAVATTNGIYTLYGITVNFSRTDL